MDIEMVIYLTSTPEDSFRRIQTNAGGDRAGRMDDDLESIKNKLEIFNKRTELLINYYRSKKIRIEIINVAQDTTVEDIYRILT
jgi:adenylate kinase family enzyme